MSTIWSFDLGKASIGEAVRDTKTNQFLHKDSLLIPAEFASTKDAATRRRMWRTRQAHKAREAWLDEVCCAAEIEGMLKPLRKREPGRVDANGNPIPKNEWKAKKGKWVLAQKADYRLEREFAPRQFKKDSEGKRVRVVYPGGKAKDGAPAVTKEDFDVCYNSALLRIKLLRGEKLEPWQIYKALHSAIQKRGYDKPENLPWANKEAARKGISVKEMAEKEEADLKKKDPAYRDAVTRWEKFKRGFRAEERESDDPTRNPIPVDYQFPCYYDAFQMGLWNPVIPQDILRRATDHSAGSTRRVRFDRAEIDKEVILLANKAAGQIRALGDAFEKRQKEGVIVIDEISGQHKGRSFRGRRVRRVKVLAKDFGEFLCYGPGGKAYASCNPEIGDSLTLEILEHPLPHKIGKMDTLLPGSEIDWLAATGQKVPRFDNRIVDKCSVIPRLNVCRMAPKLVVEKTQSPRRIDSHTLLPAEVTFLLQLKNIQVDDPQHGGVRFLTTAELSDWLTRIRKRVSEDSLADGWERRVLGCHKITRPQWNTWCNRMGIRPMKEGSDCDADTPEASVLGGDDEKESKSNSKDIVKAPRSSGRSRFSRPALVLLRALLLNDDPDAFRKFVRKLPCKAGWMLVFLEGNGQHEVLKILRDGEDREYARMGLLLSDLDFLDKVWQPILDDHKQRKPYRPHQIRIPDMALRYLRKKHDLTLTPYSQLLRNNDPELDRRNKAIYELIGEQNNPVVRDRLARFWKRLRHFQNPEESPDPKKQPAGLGFPEPECLVLEFVRDDKDNSLDGQKRTKKLTAAMDRQKERREKTKVALIKAGIDATPDMILRRMLYEDQGCACIYENDAIKCSNLEDAEIEHIIPRSLGGPDAYFNWIICTPDANAEKGDRIPYAWFRDEKTDAEWKEYKRRVQDHETTLGSRKADLLTRPDAAELVGQKYTSLAETAWVARLAQSVARLHFGWPLDDDTEEERVITISGSLTARIRRKYLLDSLLGPTERKAKKKKGEIDYAEVREEIDRALEDLDKVRREDDLPEEEAKRRKEERDRLRGKIDKLSEPGKNRDDKRHHVLDAMLLTFLPNWARDKAKADFFRFRGRNGEPIIGDNPLYAAADAPKIECINREIKRLTSDTALVRNEIKRAKKEGDTAKMQRLKDSIFPQRKRMAQLFQCLDKFKQPRNVRAVRDWFKAKLGIGPDVTPSVIPSYIAREHTPPEATFYRSVYLVRGTGGSAVALCDLGTKEDARRNREPFFELKWLFTRIQAIASKDSDGNKKLKNALREALKRKLTECTMANVPLDGASWREICESETIRGLFPKMGGKKDQRLALPSECKVKLHKIEELSAKRYALSSLAYSAAGYYDWNPEYFDRQIQRLLKRIEAPLSARKRGKPIRLLATPQRSETTNKNLSRWPGFETHVELRDKLISLKTEIETKLAPLLLGPKPKKVAVEEESGEESHEDVPHKEAMTYDEQKKRWEETWDEFVKQHCFGNKKVHLAPADLNDPNARPEYPSLYTVIFERQEQQFSVATLMKASKSIPNRGLELTLHSFASALQKVGDRKAQERCWRQAAPFIRPLSKKELSEVEGISIENWIAAFRHKGGPAIKSAKQTVGKSLEEYCDLSKDMSGIYAKGSNHGYLLGKKDEEKGSKYFAHAIRFDETEIETKTRLQRDGWHLLNYQPWNPWRGGDVLYLPNDVVTPKKRDSIPKGFYFLSSIQNGTGVNLAGCFGDNVPQAIPLGLLCEAGLCRQH